MCVTLCCNTGTCQVFFLLLEDLVLRVVTRSLQQVKRRSTSIKSLIHTQSSHTDVVCHSHMLTCDC